MEEIKVTVPDKWKAYKPENGFISVCSEVNSHEICKLEISDFDNEEHAIRIANAIASLPDLLIKKK